MAYELPKDNLNLSDGASGDEKGGLLGLEAEPLYAKTGAEQLGKDKSSLPQVSNNMIQQPKQVVARIITPKDLPQATNAQHHLKSRRVADAVSKPSLDQYPNHPPAVLLNDSTSDSKQQQRNILQVLPPPTSSSEILQFSNAKNKIDPSAVLSKVKAGLAAPLDEEDDFNKDSESAYQVQKTNVGGKLGDLKHNSMLPIYAGEQLLQHQVQHLQQHMRQQQKHMIKVSNGLKPPPGVLTGSRTSQSQARQLSRVKNRPQGLTVSGMGPLQVASGHRSQIGNQMQIGTLTTSHQKPIERPLKNKFIHKAGSVQAKAVQNIPLHEQPRNMGLPTDAVEVSDSDLEQRIQGDRSSWLEPTTKEISQHAPSGLASKLANINPVLHNQAQQRKVRSVLRSNAGYSQKSKVATMYQHDPSAAINTGNSSSQALSQRPPMKQNTVKKADLTPYMAAVDPNFADNSQMRTNSMGFYTGQSQKLFSQRTENNIVSRGGDSHLNKMARNQGNHSGFFGQGDVEVGQKSLNDKLRETFNLPESTSSQLPGIDDHSPTNVRRQHFNNIMNGVNNSTRKIDTMRTNNLYNKPIIMAASNPSNKSASKRDEQQQNVLENQKQSTGSTNHARSVSQPRQAMQPRQRHITQRIEMSTGLPSSSNRQNLGVQSSAVNSRAPYLVASSPQAVKSGPKSVAVVGASGFAAGQSTASHNQMLATNTTTSSGFIKTFNLPSSSSGLKQPSLSPYMVSQQIINRANGIQQLGGRSQAPQILDSSSASKPTRLPQHGAAQKELKATLGPLQPPSNSQPSSQSLVAKLQHQLYQAQRASPSSENLQHSSTNNHTHAMKSLDKNQPPPYQDYANSKPPQALSSQQSSEQRRILATKRITKIYEVPGFPLSSSNQNSSAMRKIQAKTMNTQAQQLRSLQSQYHGSSKPLSKSTNPRTRQQMQLQNIPVPPPANLQNRDLGSLVQINEDSIMSQGSITTNTVTVADHEQRLAGQSQIMQVGERTLIVDQEAIVKVAAAPTSGASSNTKDLQSHARQELSQRQASPAKGQPNRPPGLKIPQKKTATQQVAQNEPLQKRIQSKQATMSSQAAAAVRQRRMRSRDEFQKGSNSGTQQQKQAHLNSWSLNRSKPAPPSVENYVVNIDGTIRQSSRGPAASGNTIPLACSSLTASQQNLASQQPNPVTTQTSSVLPKAVQPKKKLARPSAQTQGQISSRPDDQADFQVNAKTSSSNENKVVSESRPGTDKQPQFLQQHSTNLHEESKMSSIHEIAKTTPMPVSNDEKPKVLRSDDPEEYQILPDSENDANDGVSAQNNEEIQGGEVQDKQKIPADFAQFEKSISQIDSKFNILNSNLQKYQQLTECARVALISRENTASRKKRVYAADFSSTGGHQTDRIGDEADSSVLNIEDISNNADQVSGRGRTFDNKNASLNGGQDALLLAITGEEEGDDYESDFDQDGLQSQVTPHSAASPFNYNTKRKLMSRSNAQSKQAFSPKVFSQTRSQVGTAGGPRQSESRQIAKVGSGSTVQSPWVINCTAAQQQQQNTARSSCSLVTVNSVLTQPQGFRPTQMGSK